MKGTRLSTAPSMPLAGVRVLELTRFIAGPYCGAILADLGADVLKIESMHGDPSRLEGPWLEGESLYFTQMNRNKSGQRLDLRSQKGKSRLSQLIRKTDILIDNHRPGVLEDMGFGVDAIEELNPQCILVRISGFGIRSQRPAFDAILQCASGLAMVSGQADSGPILVGSNIVDVATALTATVGALAALRRRSTTRAGEVVEVNMLDVAIGLLETEVSGAAAGAGDPVRIGNEDRTSVPANTYKTSDGWIYIRAASDGFWSALIGVMGLDSNSLNPAFSTARGRLENRAAVNDLLAQWVRKHTTSQLEATLLDAGVPVSPVNTLSEAIDDRRLGIRERFVEVPSPGGVKMPVVLAPMRFKRSPVSIRKGVPK